MDPARFVQNSIQLVKVFRLVELPDDLVEFCQALLAVAQVEERQP